MELNWRRRVDDTDATFRHMSFKQLYKMDLLLVRLEASRHLKICNNEENERFPNFNLQFTEIKIQHMSGKTVHRTPIIVTRIYPASPKCSQTVESVGLYLQCIMGDPKCGKTTGEKLGAMLCFIKIDLNVVKLLFVQ